MDLEQWEQWEREYQRKANRIFRLLIAEIALLLTIGWLWIKP